MIYVTVGNFQNGFDRLVRAMDAIAGAFGEEVVAQIGGTAYRPCHMNCFTYTGAEECERYIREASVVVAHAGSGTIMTAQRHGTPIVIVPRRKKYGEHYTDHQMELCRALGDGKRPGVFVAEDTGRLAELILRAKASGRHGSVESATGRQQLMSAIRAFLSEKGLL